MPNSFDREKRILDYLKNNGRASIQQLVEALGVSNMTVHRDLNKLVESGQIVKKYGGAVLVSEAENSHACAMCRKIVQPRTEFIVQFASGEEKRACCAHCGLMLQSRLQGVWQSLTADYLYGHMVSAGQAFYVTGSDVNVCCVPSVLSFGSRQDAEKFQKGFGGQLLGMDETVKQLQGLTHMHSGV